MENPVIVEYKPRKGFRADIRESGDVHMQWTNFDHSTNTLYNIMHIVITNENDQPQDVFDTLALDYRAEAAEAYNFVLSHKKD